MYVLIVPYIASCFDRMLSNVAVADGDYVPVNDQILQFQRGDITKQFSININDDHVCEKDIYESFFSNIGIESNNADITVLQHQATITIVDSKEDDCGM